MAESGQRWAGKPQVSQTDEKLWEKERPESPGMLCTVYLYSFVPMNSPELCRTGWFCWMIYLLCLLPQLQFWMFWRRVAAVSLALASLQSWMSCTMRRVGLTGTFVSGAQRATKSMATL